MRTKKAGAGERAATLGQIGTKEKVHTTDRFACAPSPHPPLSSPLCLKLRRYCHTMSVSG